MSFAKNFFGAFKEFAVKGNMVEMAVGIVIGAAFNGVISSLVEDIVMPPLGLLIGRVDFSSLYVNLSRIEYESFQEAQAAGAPTLNYGLFINVLISFLLTAFAVFIVVRIVNRLRSEESEKSAPTPTTHPCPFCTKEISRKAVKCPFCTADVEPKLIAEEA